MIPKFEQNGCHDADDIFKCVVLELYLCVFISSSDIASAAYLMPSRPSVWRQPFFKSDRLPQFSSKLSDIWLECAQQYCPKTCGIRILICCLYFQWILTTKICQKIGNFGGFQSFSQKNVNMKPQNLVYSHIVGTFRCLWEMVLVGKIFGPVLAPNRAKIGQYIGYGLFFFNFHWIHSKLYKLVGATFVGV